MRIASRTPRLAAQERLLIDAWLIALLVDRLAFPFDAGALAGSLALGLAWAWAWAWAAMQTSQPEATASKIGNRAALAAGRSDAITPAPAASTATTPI